MFNHQFDLISIASVLPDFAVNKVINDSQFVLKALDVFEPYYILNMHKLPYEASFFRYN
jgi:hypothetical protein